MKILAIDSSNQPLSVAIVEGDNIFTEQIINIKRNHSLQLMPAVEEALRKANPTLEDIDRIAVAKGPGSYTGLRIAVTVAKSSAWAQKKEVAGISSLKVVAANSTLKNGEYVVPIFDARCRNIYTGLYQRNDRNQMIKIKPDTHIAAEQYAERLASLDGTFQLIGVDAESFYDTFKEKLGDRVTLADPILNLPRGSVLAFLAQEEEAIPVHDLVPNYLKLAEAEENWLKENPDHEGDDWVEKV